MAESQEFVPPVLYVPEDRKQYLDAKMGFQLNGYETVLQAVPGTTGDHCESCCGLRRPEYFLMESGDLWVVNQHGTIAVLPFGDNEFQVKYQASNYISWRPYRPWASTDDGCYGASKDSFLKPFWKDYIGFQTDDFECVIFWRRNLIYKGKFDGRGTAYQYAYNERLCDNTSWNTHTHHPFDLDGSGNIQWENKGTEENPDWQPMKSDRYDTYFYTQKDCHNCMGEIRPWCRCGHVAGKGTQNLESKWKYWDCLAQEWVENYCNTCSGGNDQPFDRNGNPSPSPPQDVVSQCAAFNQNSSGMNYTAGTRCESEVCAARDPVFCGFQITGCENGNTARFIVNNNTWDINKWYRVVKYVNNTGEIPGFWRPASDNFPPPDRDITQELASEEIYNSVVQGLKDWDVIAVLNGWESIPKHERDVQASWYFLRHEYWYKGDGTLHDLRHGKKEVMVGILFENELTSIDSCKSEENIPVVPGGSLTCCGDWWAANFGQSAANRVVGYRSQLLLNVPGVAYTGQRPNPYGSGNYVTELMQEQMTCCMDGNWLFVRYSTGNNTQKNILYALSRNSAGVITGASETWSSTTSYSESWTACCNTDRPSLAYGAVKNSYLALANLWTTKKRALFSNGRFLQVYDWSGLPCGDVLGRSSTGCDEWRGNRFHAEQCVADAAWCNVSNRYQSARWDIWDNGVKTHSCIEACSIQNYGSDFYNQEPTWVFLKGMDIEQVAWTGPSSQSLCDGNSYSCRVFNCNGTPGGTCSRCFVYGTLSQTLMAWKKFGIILETGTVYVRSAGVFSIRGMASASGDCSGLDNTPPTPKPIILEGSYYPGITNAVSNYAERMNPQGHGYARSDVCFSNTGNSWYDVSCNCSPGTLLWSNPTGIRSSGRGYYLTDLNLRELIVTDADYSMTEWEDRTWDWGCYVKYAAYPTITLNFVYYDPKRVCRITAGGGSPGPDYISLPSGMPNEVKNRPIPLGDRFFPVDPVTTSPYMTASQQAGMEINYSGPAMCGIPPTTISLSVRQDVASSDYEFQVPFYEGGVCGGSFSGRNDVLWVIANAESPSYQCQPDPCASQELAGSLYSVRSVISEPWTCQYKMHEEFQFDNSQWQGRGLYDPALYGLVSTCSGPSRLNCLGTGRIDCASYGRECCLKWQTSGTYSWCVEYADVPTYSSCWHTAGRECYAWVSNSECRITDPDSMSLELQSIDYFVAGSYGSISGDCPPMPSGMISSPDCGNYLFSCSSNRILVNGYLNAPQSMATQVKIVIFDKLTGNTGTRSIPYRKGTSPTRYATYRAICCGPYWRLETTFDGITDVELFYLGGSASLAVWSLPNADSYSFVCCQSGHEYGIGATREAGNSDGELGTLYVNGVPTRVWNCGKEITGSIPTLQHQENGYSTYRPTCCGKYAIISTGSYKLDYGDRRSVVYSGNSIDKGASYCYLADGKTRCVVDSVVTVENREYVGNWRTEDKGWLVPDFEQYGVNRQNSRPQLLTWAQNHLPFWSRVVNTRSAYLFYCDDLKVTDRRLETIRCFKCGDDTFALAPILDDSDIQRFALYNQYSYSTDDGYCYYWGETYMGRWIHNASSRMTEAPTLEGTDHASIRQKLANWLDSYPFVGLYMLHNGSIQTMNGGFATDIQEKFPPDADKPSPEGNYWYVSDRNSPVLYCKQTGSDQAWNHSQASAAEINGMYCGNIPITLSAMSLEDLPGSPVLSCQGKERQGVEGHNRGRVTISGNGMLRVFDTNVVGGSNYGHGLMEFDATTFCQLK